MGPVLLPADDSCLSLIARAFEHPKLIKVPNHRRIINDPLRECVTHRNNLFPFGTPAVQVRATSPGVAPPLTTGRRQPVASERRCDDRVASIHAGLIRRLLQMHLAKWHVSGERFDHTIR